jgi:5-methylcytosine-specific restriction protein A
LGADVGTTSRKAMTPTRRLRIFEAHAGLCVICGGRIDGVREKWIVEHVRALGLGGADDDANCGPAHDACANVKTQRDDIPAIAKAKRRKMKALGIKKPSTFPKPAPGTRYDWGQGRYVKDANP